MSKTVIKKIKVPQKLNNQDLLRLVNEQLSGINKECEIEACVAQLYNLSSNELEMILDKFVIEKGIKSKILKLMENKECEIIDIQPLCCKAE